MNRLKDKIITRVIISAPDRLFNESNVSIQFNYQTITYLPKISNINGINIYEGLCDYINREEEIFCQPGIVDYRHPNVTLIRNIDSNCNYIPRLYQYQSELYEKIYSVIFEDKKITITIFVAEIGG